MSREAQQAEQLAQAILARAAKLADEQRKQAQQTVARLQAESRARLQHLEARESAAAKAEAERIYRRLVQAGELRMQAKLDSQRWVLAQTVLARLPEEIRAFVADRPNYLPFLRELMRISAAAIERDHVIAEVSGQDLQDLQADIATLGAAKQIDLQLSTDPAWLGGVLMYSADRRIRIDNTLHGRLQQRDDDLHHAVLTQLFSTDAS
jgi:V/A-type H+/Na+-transporting ATPase subunit E